MRISTLFSRTRRESGKNEESAGSDLLTRAGYIRKLAAGIYSYLPPALRVMRRIEAIIREEMEAIGAQEILMPVVNPADIWKESGRWYQIDAEMGRFSDRAGRDMVLAMTHEEVVADLVRNEIHSYRQLPCLVYHIQTKWRDDPRPRAGLIRVREFAMKDSYSLDRDAKGMQKQYEKHYEAYLRIFARCGIPVTAVQSDMGMMGGTAAHEFMYLSDSGEDTIIACAACGYAANRQIARQQKPQLESGPASEVAAEAIETVHTPGCGTIRDLSEFLGVEPDTCAKAVFMIAAAETPADERFVVAVVPGSYEVNETKLAGALKTDNLRPATDEEIRAHGMEPGYGSPVGAADTYVVVDDSIPHIGAMVTGANKPDYHRTGVRYGRDYTADIVTDIVAAEAGSACPSCGQPLSASRAIEVGNIFQLGTRYSDALGCTFLDDQGHRLPVYMGSYGIGIGRLMACVVAEHHDENGLMWPSAVSPFNVHIVNLARDTSHAERIYHELRRASLSVLYDDREERAGVKFNDADLIGVPLQITLGDRSLKNGQIETKIRRTGERGTIPVDDAPAGVTRLLETTTDSDYSRTD